MENNSDIVILFDLDGTLIDSTEAIVGCFYHSFKELNFDFQGNDEDIKNEIGYPLDVMYETLGVPKENVWDFVDSYKNEYRKVSEEKTTLLPEAYEAVKLASSFARLGIVTTKTTLYTIPLLKNFKIFDFFETIIGRQEVTNPKPHPEPIFKAMENLNITSDDTIYMIGDTKLDLIAAKEAGVQGIGVLCGYGKKEELSNYTTKIYADALEAIQEIKIHIKR
ncbi:HAD family hydrolase [Arcobacter sp. 15-2]|uniref:HAD family hydrolase n=1 Tax=Arcobacter sp. 15-2 TaxID=3374109 RepID=UPI00399D4937